MAKPARGRASWLPGVFSRVRVSVRAKITAPFLIVALAMAALAGFLLYQVVFENLDQRFNNQLLESGQLASEWMIQEENARLTSLRILSRTDGVGEALLARDSEALRKAALGYAIGNQEEAVEFLDAEGRLVLSMRHRPGSLYVEDYVFATGSPVDYRQWAFVARALAGEVDARGDKYVGMAQAPWGNYLYFSGPVYDRTKRRVGVVLVGRSVENLVHRMRLAIGAQFTIYDPSGQPLASTFTSVGLSPGQAAVVLREQNQGSLRRDVGGHRSLALGGMGYGELLSPWRLRGGLDQGFVGTAAPKDFLVRTSARTRIQLVTLVGLALFLVLVLGGMIAHRITRPLMSLVGASKEVMKGHLGVKVNCESNDELADLTEHFNHMSASIQESHQNIMKAYDSTLEGWVKATDLRDNDTERHMRNVVDLTVRLANRMGYQGDQLTTIYRGALLHDVGKIGVSDAVLKKPGMLTPEERIEMQRHTQFAFEILSPIDYLGTALLIPYYHHERWDGTGYPIGLKGEEIPESARIFAIVDVWDAMTSDRVYRRAMSHDEVVKHLRDQRGSHFDPRVVDMFLEMIGRA